jgi:hypothetical protein
LPVPFSAPGFALLAAGALLGGGALLRADSFSMRFTGALVLGLPLILLSIGYSQGAASHGATEFLLVLVLSTVVIAALGYATRERAPGDSRGQGEQLLELLERARTAEARATFAEQQLASAGYGSFAVQSPRLLSDDDELARMRGGGSGKGLLWVAIMFLTGSLAAGYLAGYVPLQNRLDAQRRTAEAKGEHNTRAMTALRSRFDTERSALQAQLRAAQAAQADAVAAAAKVSAAAAGQPLGDKAEPAAKQKPVDAKRPEAKTAESQAPEKAKVSAPTVDARAGSTHATRPARKTKVSARAAAVKSAAGKPAAAAEAHYDDEALDDDPIGGL